MKVLKYLVIAPLRFARVRKTLKYIRAGSKVLDIGCGDGYLLMKLKGKIKSGVGLDERAGPQKFDNVEIKKFSVKEKLPFRKASFDAVTMTALIEHLDNPDKVLGEVNRVLKTGGICIITTPTQKAKPVWEFLVRLGLSDEEADEEGVHAHKRYFTPRSLKRMLENAKFEQISSSYFEFGMNYIVVAGKI